MPRAGASHSVLGIWPPEDIPPRVWTTLTAWRRCDRWKRLPGDGDPMRQEAWTMDAFDVLDATLADIKKAHREHDQWKARAKK